MTLQSFVDKKGGVHRAAENLHVTRQTVYNWLSGSVHPSRRFWPRLDAAQIEYVKTEMVQMQYVGGL